MENDFFVYQSTQITTNMVVNSKKRKLYDPNPIQSDNRRSLEQQQSNLRNFFSNHAESSEQSSITIKIQQHHHYTTKPSSSSAVQSPVSTDCTQNSFIDLTNDDNDNDNDNNDTAHRGSTFSIQIQTHSPPPLSKTNLNMHDAAVASQPKQQHEQTAPLAFSAKSSRSAPSIDSSQYNCNFNIREIKQSCRRPSRSSKNTADHDINNNTNQPPQQQQQLHINSSNSDNKQTHYHEQQQQQTQNPRENDSVSAIDDSSSNDSSDTWSGDSADGDTLYSESERSVDTDSNISQVYSIITESLHYLEDVPLHKETIKCRFCNITTTITTSAAER